MFRQQLRSQKGLTLVELMVVVAIIAIIAAVAITVFQDIQKKAKLAADQGNVAAMRSAVAIYYGKKNGVFPPDLAAVQALVTPAGFGTPRRTVLGADYNRVCLLLAVLEKRVGFPLQSQDAFVNVAGGAKVFEPAADLGLVLAAASSYLDRPLRGDLVVLGEVGLAGEIRAVTGLETRLKDFAQREKALVQQESTAQALRQELEKNGQQLADQTAALDQRRQRLESSTADLARSSAELKAQREELQAHLHKLAEAQQELGRQRQTHAGEVEAWQRRTAELSSREQEIAAMSADLDQRAQQIMEEEARIAESKTAIEEKQRELEITARSLAALEKELKQELSQLSDQKNELLPRFGTDEQQLAKGAPRADRNVPKVDDGKARESLQRFQKLCRDAKRRVVGAG